MLLAFTLRRDNPNLSQSQIAERLGLKQSMVSRLLQRSTHFMEVHFNMPRRETLEAGLISKYGLSDAVVVETPDQQLATTIVGQAAARYFLEKVGDGASVALSCGCTLAEMVNALPTRPTFRLKISQTGIESDERSVHEAPSTLVGILRGKSSPHTDAVGVQLPPPRMAPRLGPDFRRELRNDPIIGELRERIRSSAFIFVGAGTVLPHDGQEPGSFHRIFAEATKKPQSVVSELGLVGEMNNCVYDAEGRDRTHEISELAEHVTTLLGLEDFRALARNHLCHKVILVATGPHKVEAIRVALARNLVNVVITGTTDAERMMP